MEELEESEVLWAHHHHLHHHHGDLHASLEYKYNCDQSWKRAESTSPIRVPKKKVRSTLPGLKDDEEKEEKMVPPHEIVARRKMGFADCVGNGRALKGRDLRRVRDSVLRMTGFLETY